MYTYQFNCTFEGYCAWDGVYIWTYSERLVHAQDYDVCTCACLHALCKYIRMQLGINLRKYVRVDTSSVSVHLQVRVFCMRTCHHTSSIHLLCFVLLSLSASLRHRVAPKTRTALRHISFFNNSSSSTLPILYRSSLPPSLPPSYPPSLPPLYH